jgi:D-arginine dehydrogenase
VIGGGLAGLAAAAGLASAHRVVLLEQESALAYHATGRSAALYAESYGNTVVRALTRASRSFYVNGDSNTLTQARGAMFAGDRSQIGELESLHGILSLVSARISLLGFRAATDRCAALGRETLAGAVFDPDARDIDVGLVVDHYRRQFRSAGGELRQNARATVIRRESSEWYVEAAGQAVVANVVVNAAGAWADSVATLAGIRTVGLEPRRRTAARVSPGSWTVRDWPCVIDVTERWYFRPDAGALLVSPADETPSSPCDAQPDDLDVALAIDRIEAATLLEIHRPMRSWAGLRTFASDRTPVVGFDSGAPGFFWLAGQGGYGIQTAPALADLTVSLVTGAALPPSVAAEDVDPRELSPSRFDERAS